MQPEAKSEKVQQRVDGTIGQAVGWVIWLAVVFAIVGGATVWWNDNHWSGASENAFLANCQASGGSAKAGYCECALHQVEQSYGPKESDTVLTSNSDVVNQIASHCAGQ